MFFDIPKTWAQNFSKGNLMKRIGIKNLSYILVLFFSISCAEIRYKSSGIIPVELSQNQFHRNKSTIKVEKNFFLWGLYPFEQVIEIDKEFERRNLSAVSSVKIREKSLLSDTMLSLITLGLVIPRTVYLEGASP